MLFSIAFFENLIILTFTIFYILRGKTNRILIYFHFFFVFEILETILNLICPLGVTGIVLPSGSNKLYSGNKNEGIRVWDCHTSQCTCTIPLDVEVGCLLNEDSWLFVGMPIVVKVIISFHHEFVSAFTVVLFFYRCTCFEI